jgi:D-alanyl-D-alanine carboxypeptidase
MMTPLRLAFVAAVLSGSAIVASAANICSSALIAASLPTPSSRTAWAAGPAPCVVSAQGASRLVARATADTALVRERVQAYLDSLHAVGRFPGATLGVALPDGNVMAFAIGSADTVLRTPLTPTSKMLAGSVGKTFFAALALQLVDEGRLDLDAPISTWLGTKPWFARLPNGADITVRMLMNHTSGLVRYEFDPRVTEKLTAEPDHVWTPEERVGYVLDTEPPFAAGSGWQYSDTNYIVLGMIMERITGAPLYPQIRTRVIDRVGLANTVPSDRR